MTSNSPTFSDHETTAPVIRLVDLHKSFGALRVLDGVSMEFFAGKTTVVFGPSGTGKSVLLKHIAALLKPDSGEVWFGTQRVDQLSDVDLVDVRKKIGFLFQRDALFDSMNICDNVCFPLAQHTTMTPDQQERRCAEVLKMVGLDRIERMMPAALSGGQRKRVALARAVVLGPEVVLYDEPTTGLDPIRADVINELILSLADRLGVTSIVVTHDMASANKIADHMVMLYDGKVVADGDPSAIRDAQSDVVQRFIRGQADQADLDRIHRGFEPIGQAEP